MSQYWAIYAPAADLGRGGHISGPLSGIEPQFPVTRYCHPGPLNHDQRLIGQKFVRSCRTPEGAHPARAKSHEMASKPGSSFHTDLNGRQCLFRLTALNL